MSQIITFSPAASVFGFGALEKLPNELKSRHFKRVLIITDPQIASVGILQKVLDLMEGSFDVEVFDDAPTEPHSSDVDRQKERFGSDFDAILGLGGGSSMDFAKALTIVMTHGGALGNYVGEVHLPGPVIPVVCVPTTSGTGSQNTQTTVFTIEGIKLGASSEYIRPVVSIVDPELTMGLPPSVTRDSGYDALMHACESFLALPSSEVADRPILYQGSNPFSQALSLEAFRYIWSSYRTAISDGSNREARMGMSIGSHLAGLAFSHSGLGLVHVLASSLGGMIDAPHGMCLAACTRIGLNYNLKACEEKFAILAGHMGNDVGARVAPKTFIDRMLGLIRDLDLPSRPSELGLKSEETERLLKNALVQTRRIKTNPRPLDDELFSYIQEGI
ncbi:MAG: iron-containing alcohol dehydrogenase [Desulfobacteraceae bacterium]|nr:iron-containing alcohol dehydrogenase [Desulfobacteraceae bacterium]